MTTEEHKTGKGYINKMLLLDYSGLTFNRVYVKLYEKTSAGDIKMPMPLSQEVRKKIIFHKLNGEKNKDIIKWLQVSKNSITRIWSQYKTKNTIKPKEHKRGRKPAFDEKTMDKITTRIKEKRDITLEELVEEFDLKISISALCRKLKAKDLTFKKRRYFVKNNFVPMSNGCVVSD